MKKIEVSIENQTVTEFNEFKQTYETCNFQEAGLLDSEQNPMTDEAEIEEALIEREEAEIVFI